MYKDCVLDVIYLVYAHSIWIFNDGKVEIGELWTFLGGHREVLVDTNKEMMEEVGSGLGRQEVICGASKYQNLLDRFFLKGVESMIYDILEKSKIGED